MRALSSKFLILMRIKLSISTEMLMNEKLPNQVFRRENCPNASLAKVAKFHTNPYNFVACLPIHTNSLFWVILEKLPFCYFPPPNTSIRGKDSQIYLILHLNILVFRTTENNHTLSQSSHVSVMAFCVHICRELVNATTKWQTLCLQITYMMYPIIW